MNLASNPWYDVKLTIQRAPDESYADRQRRQQTLDGLARQYRGFSQGPRNGTLAYVFPSHAAAEKFTEDACARRGVVAADATESLAANPTRALKNKLLRA